MGERGPFHLSIIQQYREIAQMYIWCMWEYSFREGLRVRVGFFVLGLGLGFGFWDWDWGWGFWFLFFAFGYM